MPTRKIADLPGAGWSKKRKPPEPPCRRPEHEPPMHMVYEPGIYEHECPGCGSKTMFTVPWRSTCSSR